MGWKNILTLGRSKPQLDLRTLILILTIISSSIALVSSIYAIRRVQRESLINSTLDSNEVYSAKLAATVNHYIEDSRHALRFSAKIVNGKLDQLDTVKNEIKRLQLQAAYFDSIYIVNKSGILKSIWPERLKFLEKRKIDTLGSQLALSQKEPLISPPYMSSADNLVVMVSHPVVDESGNYQGYMGGSIYLHNSAMQRLVNEHKFKDGTYVYLVNNQGQIIYHPETDRIGKTISKNPAVQKLMQGKSGRMTLTNTHGIKMLAGYAALPDLGWGIIVQRPLEDTLSSLEDSVYEVITHMIPVILIMAPLIFAMTYLISSPLKKLATAAHDITDKDCLPQIRSSHDWYFEAKEMKRALLSGATAAQEKINYFQSEANRDPMTGILNRRGMENPIKRWHHELTPFSIIALDIDHFKIINDTYGHDQGDKVIQAVSELIIKQARDTDIACRTGGEEFLLLLPGTPIGAACKAAERLRHEVENLQVIPGHPLSISIGVAYHDHEKNQNIKQTLNNADKALYMAKHTGRNRVVSEQSITSSAEYNYEGSPA